jgi:hypothetical protein
MFRRTRGDERGTGTTEKNFLSGRGETVDK